MTAKAQKKAPSKVAPKTAPQKTVVKTAAKTAPQKFGAVPDLDDDDFEVIQTGTLNPFVDWKQTPVIEGVVSNPRQVTGGQYGAQDVVDVGDYTVGLVSALANLPDHVGEYVRITCEGMVTTKKGNNCYAFTIQRKKQ